MQVLKLFRVDGQVALITGASKGLGRAAARALAEAGASTVLFARSDMSDVVAELAALGGKCIALQGDVSKPEDVERAVELSMTEFGQLDILVNNAGIVEQVAMAHELPLEEWQKVMSVDLTGTFLCCKEALKVMTKRGRGNIINISSMWGLVGISMFNGAGYAAAKGAVNNLTRELAKQYGPHGIRVNCIAPGFFETEIAGGVYKTEGFKEAAARSTPVGRVAASEEIGGTVVYLASEASSYVTGSVVVVDGGFLVV